MYGATLRVTHLNYSSKKRRKKTGKDTIHVTRWITAHFHLVTGSLADALLTRYSSQHFTAPETTGANKFNIHTSYSSRSYYFTFCELPTPQPLQLAAFSLIFQIIIIFEVFLWGTSDSKSIQCPRSYVSIRIGFSNAGVWMVTFLSRIDS